MRKNEDFFYMPCQINALGNIIFNIIYYESRTLDWVVLLPHIFCNIVFFSSTSIESARMLSSHTSDLLFPHCGRNR